MQEIETPGSLNAPHKEGEIVPFAPFVTHTPGMSEGLLCVWDPEAEKLVKHQLSPSQAAFLLSQISLFLGRQFP